MIHIGFEKGTGKRVSISLQHTIITSITRWGKSTTLAHMTESLPPDYKIFCFDVKRPRDFEGIGQEIPVYIENRTDPRGLLELLETSERYRLRFEFSELIKVCKQLATEDERGTYDFSDILEGINRALQEKIHPIRESKLLVLQHFLSRLISDLSKIKFSDELRLPYRVNVMNLSEAPMAVKQLAVYSTIKRILEKFNNVVIMLDELPDFAPQRYGTLSKRMIIEAIRKGGASGIWLWLAGQTITGVDKEVLKQCNLWLLGRQRELREAERTLKQIPFETGFTRSDIMKLPVGHFIVVSEEEATFTYVQPPWLDKETARKVALGEISVDEVTKPRRVTEIEKLKAQLMEKEAIIQKQTEEIAELQKVVDDCRKTNEELRLRREELIDIQKKLASITGKEVIELPDIIGSLREPEKKVWALLKARGPLFKSQIQATLGLSPKELNAILKSLKRKRLIKIEKRRIRYLEPLIPSSVEIKEPITLKTPARFVSQVWIGGYKKRQAGITIPKDIKEALKLRRGDLLELAVLRILGKRVTLD